MLGPEQEEDGITRCHLQVSTGDVERVAYLEAVRASVANIDEHVAWIAENIRSEIVRLDNPATAMTVHALFEFVGGSDGCTPGERPERQFNRIKTDLNRRGQQVER